jgi:hypothetical protein
MYQQNIMITHPGLHRWLTTLTHILLISLSLTVGCKPKEPPPKTGAEGDSHSSQPSTAPGRIDIPPSVRQNLGITFATAQPRSIASTRRLPGTFELLPTARRNYRAPLPGIIQPLVNHLDAVQVGTPIATLRSSQWRDLHSQLTSLEAKLQSMGPLREAHRVHERALADRVTLWQERIAALTQLRSAGGGSATELTQARDTLNDTQAQLADVMEKDAQLAAEESQAKSDVTATLTRRTHLLAATGLPPSAEVNVAEPAGLLTIYATASGIVEVLHTQHGELLDEHDPIITTVDPTALRFTGSALQTDLRNITTGLSATISPPSGFTGSALPIDGTITIAPVAQHSTGTVQVYITFNAAPPPWAVPGLLAFATVTLKDGTSSELSIPRTAVVRDGLESVFFRRDPNNPDVAIRTLADTGIDNGEHIVIKSGLREGDQVVTTGVYQLMLATSGQATKGGHFHSDGTFHEGED